MSNDVDYSEIPILADVYLEDSFVLGVDEFPDRIEYLLDVVLLETHPYYTPPQTGYQYCYKKAALVFVGICSIEWINKAFIQFTDATGEHDYGNIDYFTKDKDIYTLAGDWGKVRIKCNSIELHFK